MIPIAYNVRNLAVRKTTTIASAGGIALVVFVLVATMVSVLVDHSARQSRAALRAPAGTG